jgi:hypothetical protein
MSFSSITISLFVYIEHKKLQKVGEKQIILNFELLPLLWGGLE